MYKYFAEEMSWKNIFHIIAIAAVMTAAASCNGGRSSGGRWYRFQGYAQGGIYSVTANLEGVRTARSEITARIEDILEEIDTTLSGYNHNSLLSRYNAGERIEPDGMFKDMLDKSAHFKEITGGAFDVSAAPLFDIWGFGFTADSLPSPEAIAGAMELCREGRKLNFNAIAQGYTCDTIAAYLHSLGVTEMLVDIGEIYCEGLNPSGRGWTLGIDAPEDGNDRPGEKLSGTWQSDGGAYGVVTSGNYRKYYMKDGRKYSHTIDPRTGYPVTHSLLSATVVAPTATEADALATFFMVIGPDEARDYVESHDGIEACLISQGSIWKSEGF